MRLRTDGRKDAMLIAISPEPIGLRIKNKLDFFLKSDKFVNGTLS